IEQTEALVAIDINTGSFTGKSHYEETVRKTNLEAAAEAARQIRLRDLSGVIVIDFIDMKDSSHKKTIINILKEESKKDKSKVTILGFTNMGLLEIIRKRTTQPLDTNVYSQCPLCHGTGKIIAPSLVHGRLIKELLSSIKEIKKDRIKVIEINAFHNLSGYLTPSLTEELEKQLNVKLEVSFNWQNPNSYGIKYKK
ncbi:MAG: RNA binding S1 domain protein, partial [Petrotoga mobilis]